MSRSTFSGPVASTNGFEGNLTGNVAGVVTPSISTIAALPAAAAGNAGQIRLVSDAVSGAAATPVVSTGAAWIDLITGIAATAT